ncbi:hypothetical protein [Rhizobium grahamii]|uniref:Uncharacterized protein n=1 Tax=Rhizobium grahamii TaxID=1120045 RepID=A0A370KH00_9HYPH|nr:hypothetical protein [Rhizobium grahamii]RDJ03937.1 hypothetical protein B5K06_28965 [Rhizobium grahamii]
MAAINRCSTASRSYAVCFDTAAAVEGAERLSTFNKTRPNSFDAVRVSVIYLAPRSGCCIVATLNPRPRRSRSGVTGIDRLPNTASDEID